MIYTIGREEVYDASLEERQDEGRPLYKVGRKDDYEGGVVFPTPEEAQGYLDQNGLDDFAIYKVDASWSDVWMGSLRENQVIVGKHNGKGEPDES